MHELSIKPLYDSTVYVNPRVFAILSYNILFKHKAGDYAFTPPRSRDVMKRLNSKWRRRCYEKSNY